MKVAVGRGTDSEEYSQLAKKALREAVNLNSSQPVGTEILSQSADEAALQALQA